MNNDLVPIQRSAITMLGKVSSYSHINAAVKVSGDIK